jgi:hypothetical protein
VEQPSSISGVEMSSNILFGDNDDREVDGVAEEVGETVPHAEGAGRLGVERLFDPQRAISDTTIQEWLSLGATDLYQSAIEKVRGELHWKFKHLSTKKVMYDLYPEWRIPSPKHFWEGVLCSCPEGYVRGAACEHKATLRVWLGIHRSVEGVKHLLDLPF